MAPYVEKIAEDKLGIKPASVGATKPTFKRFAQISSLAFTFAIASTALAVAKDKVPWDNRNVFFAPFLNWRLHQGLENCSSRFRQEWL